MGLDVGFVLFPRLTQLDLTGPYEVFSRMPGVNVRLLWKDLDPVEADTGMQILPNMAFADCPQLDVICVPGGPGQMDFMEDEEVLGFLTRQSENARYVTSVCTGALLLGAAGLLQGYQATTHWAATSFLIAYGATFKEDRVVKDRNRVTAAGVSAGIDFALELVAEIQGEPIARAIQLGIEYDPNPPFTSGHPNVADDDTIQMMRGLMAKTMKRRTEQADRYRAD